MQSNVSTSKPTLWTSRVLSALPVLLILFGSVLKLMKTPSVIKDSLTPEFPRN